MSVSSQWRPSFIAGYISRAKLRSPRPLHQLPNRHDELRGLLGVARIGDAAVGRHLVHDPAVAVGLGRLAPQQPERLPGDGRVSRRERAWSEYLRSRTTTGTPSARRRARDRSRHVPDQPLGVDLYPVVDLLQTVVGDRDPRPSNDGGIVRLFSGPAGSHDAGLHTRRRSQLRL